MKCCTVYEAFEAMEIFASQLSGAIHIRLRWLSLCFSSSLTLVKDNITMGKRNSLASDSSSYVFLSLDTAHTWSHISACWPLPRGLMKHLLQYRFITTTHVSWSLSTFFPQGSQQCREPLWCKLTYALVDSVVIETAFSNLSRHGYICWDVIVPQTSWVLVAVVVNSNYLCAFYSTQM